MRIRLIILGIAFLTFCCRRPEILFVPVDPLEKILPEQKLFMPTEQIASTARGEHATFQFAVRSTAGIENLTISTAPFVNVSTKQKVSIENIKQSFVGYVHEGRTHMNPGVDALNSPSRFYPDPLLDDRKIDVEANVNQALWISIPISTDMLPGEYRSEVKISGKSGGLSFNRTLPIYLQVSSILVGRQTLNVVNWHQASFRYMSDQIENFTPAWWELMDQLAELMQNSRQNVVLISPLLLAEYTFDSQGNVSDINFERFDEVVNFFLSKGVLKRIAGGHIARRLGDWEGEFGYLIPEKKGDETAFRSMMQSDSRAEEFYTFFFRELSGHLCRKGWQDMYMQHVADEPIGDNAESYFKIASFVKQQLPGYMTIDAILTEDLSDCLDVWVPQLDNLHKNYSFYQNLQAKGKEVWFYTCLWPQGNYANRHIRQPLLKTRLLHWINFKYGITGYLHWGMNFWRDPDPMLETASIQPNGTVLPAGDAWIIYPYKDHLISSIRLEAMRDGIVDYELLCMLQRKDPIAAQRIADEVIYGFQKYDIDIVSFQKIRKKLLKILESLQPD